MAYAQINDIPMYYDVRGSGVPIVFIHPPLLTSVNFSYQRLLAEHHQIITFDIRGHGQSGASQEPITYPRIVEDMLLLLDLLKVDKCFICGYSTGGSIALEAQLKHPERFYGGILISAMSEVSDWWLATRISTAVALTRFKAKRLMTWAIATGNSDSIQTFLRLYHEAYLGCVENMEQFYRYSKTFNCSAQLHRIRAPQLLLYGLQDKGFHKYARILQNKLPQSKLVFFRNEKHQLPTKAYTKVNSQIKQWIETQQLTSEQQFKSDHLAAWPLEKTQEYDRGYLEP